MSDRPAEAPALDPRTSVGHVHLTVRDLPGTLRFYRDVLGFREAWTDGGRTAYLSADGLYPFHLGLTQESEPPDAARARPGLYHAAFLLPTRRALARVVERLLSSGVMPDGASDHLVSEAVYLRDPEGNGLELYADRPRERWRRRGGQILMSTEPLDLDGLLAEAAGTGGAWAGIDPGTRLGHVHLRVSDLARAEAFYHGVLGFDVVLREYPGALFLSAGGYHHHIGVNVWGSRGAAPRPAGGVGLRYFTIALPDRRELVRLVRRAEQLGVRIEAAYDHGLSETVSLRDGDGIGVVLAVDRDGGRVPAAAWHSEPRPVAALLHG